MLSWHVSKLVPPNALRKLKKMQLLPLLALLLSPLHIDDSGARLYVVITARRVNRDSVEDGVD